MIWLAKKASTLPSATSATPSTGLATVSRVTSTFSRRSLSRAQVSTTVPLCTAKLWAARPRLRVARQVGPVCSTSPLSTFTRAGGAFLRSTTPMPAV
ncbi:hypothetical protein D9M70_587670 [compost metagenome]